MHLKTSLIRMVGAGVVALLASCASDLDTTRVQMSQSSADTSTTGHLHASINEYRSSIGQSALKRHAGLDRLALEHCRFMAKNRGEFSLGSKNITHYGFKNRVLMAQRAYSMESLAENVAGGQIPNDIPGTLLKSWRDSSKHHYNLKQDWDATGLGVYVAEDGMVYATQIFATENRSHMAMRERLTSF